MSLVAIALNLLLSTLLVAALFVGWRVERRLRTLKEGQALFARSVADLNVAAARAEAGLSELKLAMSEANDSLNGRIEDARKLVGELDRRIGAGRDLPHSQAISGARRRAEGVLTLDEPIEALSQVIKSEAPARPERPLMPQRSRARVDDDLFEEPVAAPRRAFR